MRTRMDYTFAERLQKLPPYLFVRIEQMVAEKKALAEDLLAQLKDSDDPSTLFDELMKEHSEDEGLEQNPKGYTATLGQMVPAYEKAALELNYGQVSGIVESEYGYHIIIRDKVADTSEYVDSWREYQMGQQVDKWMADADIQSTEALDNLDVADFYAKFNAYQVALNEKYTAAQETPSPSVNPSEDPKASGSVEDEAVG